MNGHRALTARVSSSKLSDGTLVFTASLEEMPSVVAEGESEPAALSELLALVENLLDRLGSDFVAVRTTAIESWNWTIQAEGADPISISSEELSTVSGVARREAVA